MKRQPLLYQAIAQPPKQDGKGPSAARQSDAPKTPPVLPFSCMDIMDSRALTRKEKEAILGLLGPMHDDETRCAAAHAIARLGIEDALPIMDMMLNTDSVPQSVRSAFQLAKRFIGDMKEHSEMPRPYEHLLILMGMRNCNDPSMREYAHIVLHMADIKYGTPALQPFQGLDYAFRADADRMPASIRRRLEQSDSGEI